MKLLLLTFDCIDEAPKALASALGAGLLLRQE